MLGFKPVDGASAAHAAIDALMSKLNARLDALYSFHFMPKPEKAEVRVPGFARFALQGMGLSLRVDLHPNNVHTDPSHVGHGARECGGGHHGREDSHGGGEICDASSGG